MGASRQDEVRRLATRYGVFVGRVGALAVALGVGVMVSGGAAIAVADGDTDTTATDNDSGQPPRGADPVKAAVKSTIAQIFSAPSASSDQPRPRSVLLRLPRMQFDSSGAHTTSQDPAPGQVAARPGLDVDGNRVVSSVVRALLPSTVPSPSSTGGLQASVDSSSSSDRHTAGELASHASQFDAALQAPDTSAEPGFTPHVTTLAPGLPPLPHIESLPVQAVGVPQRHVLPPLVPPHSAPTVGSLVVALIGGLGLPPGATPWGAPHPPAPFLELAWGLYRRVESIFCNHRPVAGQPEVSTSLNSDGEISGDLNIYDPDHDHLRYHVVDGPDPAKGTVIVNPDGNFTYKTTPEFASSGGTDTFTVVADDDTCFHIHGLFGFFTPGHGHTAVQTVTVTVPPGNSTTPLYGTPVSNNVNGDSVIVSEDGSHAAVVTQDDEGKYFVTVLGSNGRAGQPIPLTGHADDGPVVNHDGSLVAVPTTTDDGKHYITVVNTQTNTVARTIDLDALAYDGQSLSLSKDGSKAAIVVYDEESNSSAVRVIDTSTGVAAESVPIDGNLLVTFNDDGTKVLVPSNVTISPGNSNFFVTVIDVATNTAGPTIPYSTSPQVPVARPFITEDGTRAIGGIRQLNPHMFWALPINLETGTTTGPIEQTGDPVSDFVLSDDGSHAVHVTQSGANRYVTIYNLDTGTASTPIDIGTVGASNSLSISADGTTAVVPGYDSSDNTFKLLVFDTAANTYTAVPLDVNGVGRPAVTANGDRAYATAQDTDGNPVLLTIDTNSGTVISTTALSGQASDSAQLTEDGSHVYVLTLHDDGKYYVDTFSTGVAPVTV